MATLSSLLSYSVPRIPVTCPALSCLCAHSRLLFVPTLFLPPRTGPTRPPPHQRSPEFSAPTAPTLSVRRMLAPSTPAHSHCLHQAELQYPVAILRQVLRIARSIYNNQGLKTNFSQDTLLVSILASPRVLQRKKWSNLIKKKKGRSSERLLS